MHAESLRKMCRQFEGRIADLELENARINEEKNKFEARSLGTMDRCFNCDQSQESHEYEEDALKNQPPVGTKRRRDPAPNNKKDYVPPSVDYGQMKLLHHENYVHNNQLML